MFECVEPEGLIQGMCFFQPIGIAVDPQTNDLYVSDNGSHRIMKVNQEGNIYLYVFITELFIEGVALTLAGCRLKKGRSDGMKEKAQFNNPWGLVS